MERAMKGLVLGMPTTSFPKHELDPSGAFVLGMARALARRGHRVEVLAPDPGSGAAWTEPAPGVTVRWLRYAWPRALQRTFHGAGAPDNLASDPIAWLGAPSFVAALAAALHRRARGWDAIASHWGVPCGWLASRTAVPHVAFFHSADVHAIERAPILARGIDGNALVFASEDLRRRFLALRPDAAERAHAMPMGIEPPLLVERAAARQALGLSSFTVLAMSRLVPIKGLDRAIDAVRDLPVELVIAGDGPERARLERRARGRVRFTGLVAGETKSSWLAAADAFVAPSIPLASGRTEGTPTAVLEAMHAGLPIVASDAGGLRDLVDATSGIVVPGAEIAALREAISRIAADDELRSSLGRGARARARSSSWDALTPKIESLLARP
jgi:glycosyltransferase involved in cell wall biosynthesis